MHEGEPDRDDEEPVPVYMTSVGRTDDVGLRGERMDAAEYIADMEERVSRRLSIPRSDKRSWRDGHDHTDPGFLYVGDRESLQFIAEMAAGIARYGQAFAFWVREMGGRPEALDEFEKVFLGQWESAEEFAQHVLDEHATAEYSERCESEEPSENLPTDAQSWAHDLERRGEIDVVPNPRGGVWVFRGW
jgi:hypothetical protein